MASDILTRGVTFDDVHTATDWGLMLRDYPEASPPEIQSKLVEVPGRDGILNLTQALDGYTHYNSRDLKLAFRYIKNRPKWWTVYSDIQNELHGQPKKIILDDEPDYYYSGMVEVDTPDYKNKYFDIKINAEVDPYKYELCSSLEDWLWDPFNFETGVIREYKDLTVNGTLTLTLVGSPKPTRPEFIVSDTDGDGLTLSYNGSTYHLTEGSSVIPAIYVKNDEYVFIFTGNGTVSVGYRGGKL